jgi:hypothetical protein
MAVMQYERRQLEDAPSTVSMASTSPEAQHEVCRICARPKIELAAAAAAAAAAAPFAMRASARSQLSRFGL